MIFFLFVIEGVLGHPISPLNLGFIWSNFCVSKDLIFILYGKPIADNILLLQYNLFNTVKIKVIN